MLLDRLKTGINMLGLNYASGTVTILLILVVALMSYRLQRAAVAKVFADEATCSRILKSTGLNDTHANLLDPLRSRALPNQRLTSTFGINNAFTTSVMKDKMDFKNQAIYILKFKHRHLSWERLHDDAGEIIKQTLTGKVVDLVTFIQGLTLRITLAVLFTYDPVNTSIEAVQGIASGINDLWLASKCPSPPDWQTQTELHTLLKQLLPSKDPLNSDPRENPMNFILPAYETLWRVVLCCFLEIQFRAPLPSREAWKNTLQTYVLRWKDQRVECDKDRAIDIAKEALRLYPPTRRVYRQFQYAPNTSPELVAADIEACQRDPSIWGADATTFNPDRWTTVQNANDHLLSFGANPFLCPAYNGFASNMIILLTDALSKGVGEDWNLKVGSKGNVPKWGVPLSSGREAYSDVYLEDSRPCN